MQKTDGIAKTTQRRLQSSTTLNRRYVKRPSGKTGNNSVVAKSSQIQHFRVESPNSAVPVRVATPKQQIEKPQKHPLQAVAMDRMQQLHSQQISAQQEEKKMTAKEIKDRAIQQALLATASYDEIDNESTKTHKLDKMHFGFGRVMLALSCTVAAVLAIVYFINLSMPDLSLRVAAMQTGINATYPEYVPMEYRNSSITAENRKIILDFQHKTENTTFTLTEETSSWDSNALLNNYVKSEYMDNYKVVKEQGLTIYISNSNAVWVNGGIFYEIKSPSADALTNKQICAIATSL